MNWLKRLIHKLQGCSGHVVTRWFKGQAWVGFKCHECGKISGQHVAYYSQNALSDTQDTEWEE